MLLLNLLKPFVGGWLDNSKETKYFATNMVIKVAIIASVIFSSIFLFECYLAYFIFKFLIYSFNYSEAHSALFTSLILLGFFIVISFLLGYYKVDKINSDKPHSCNLTSNKLMNAFIRGYNSK